MTLEMYQNIWFVLVGILLAGYSVLDGFDLGIGVLFPILAKTESEKESLLSSIWPFWDGNEVWLITGGGALFAAFPHAYATVFSGFYLALMIVVFALIFRAVSLEFWFYDVRHRKLWQWTFTAGSFLPSLLYGVALGNVVLGIPLDDKMNYTGSFPALLHPFALACGLTGLTAIILQGSLYTAMTNDGPVSERAASIAGKTVPVISALVIAGGIMSGFYLNGRTGYAEWICAAVILVLAALIKIDSAAGKFTRAFISSSMIFILLWVTAALVNYPYLVSPASGTVTGVSIYNGSSSELTLKTMLLFALFGMPLVLAYTVYVYKIFKGSARGLYGHQ